MNKKEINDTQRLIKKLYMQSMAKSFSMIKGEVYTFSPFNLMRLSILKLEEELIGLTKIEEKKSPLSKLLRKRPGRPRGSKNKTEKV